MTHRYTLLIRGTVIAGRDEPDVSAIAWAADTVIALGSDDDMREVSRGDAHVIDLDGASVVALGEGPNVLWPPDATLEGGGPADLAVLDSDPRRIDAPNGRRLSAIALVRGGRVVAGSLPGDPRHLGRPMKMPAGLGLTERLLRRRSPRRTVRRFAWLLAGLEHRGVRWDP